MVTSTATATKRISCICTILLPLAGLPGGGEQNGDECHGWDQKDVLSEDHQTQYRGGHTHHSWEVAFVAEPLFGEQSDKQGGQHEFNTFKADGNEIAGDGADHTAAYPVDVVEESDQEAVGMTLHTLRRLVLGHQRVGLIGEGEDQIGLLFAGALVSVDERNAIENVAGIQKKNGDGRGKNRGVVCQQADGEKLGRPGIHKKGSCECPGEAIAGLTQQDAKADSQKQIPGHYRNGVKENGFQSFFIHGVSSFRENWNRWTRPMILEDSITVMRE